MASMNTTHKITELPKDLFVLKVKVGRQLRFRIWLAMQIVRLATFMLNGKTQIARV
jgi:hypothetical protein